MTPTEGQTTTEAKGATRRRFNDAESDKRCGAVVTLKDGSKAQCGRAKRADGYCLQHWKIVFPAGAKTP